LTEALKDPADFVDFDLPSALKEWKLGYYTPIKRSILTYRFSKPI
jgi:histone-lysine N-methyltransferase SETD2